MKTKRFSSCSPPRPRRRSPTRARTRTNSAPRADLEALVETSPVGVVVFDANTGGVLSLNREAKRVVEQLGSPDCPLEDVPRLLTCRLADGREIAFDRFPLSMELARARTVRAEEVVLSTSDGRKVTLLCNATPITAHDGTVASVVVTMQDLAPLQELERMRADFFPSAW